MKIEDSSIFVEEVQVVQLAKKQNLWWLIKHSWKVLFLHNSWNKRVSRGESFAATITLILLYIAALGLVFGILGESIVTSITALLILFAFLYYGLKLTKQRYNDIGYGKSGMLWFIISLGSLILCITIVVVLSSGILFRLIGETSSAPNFPLIGLIGILGFISLIVFCWNQLVLMFENGTLGENRYGSDPLLSQPFTNKPYLVYGLIFWVVYIVGIIVISILPRMMQSENQTQFQNGISSQSSITIPFESTD